MKIKTQVLLTNVQERKIKETGEIKFIYRFVDLDDGKSIDVWSTTPLPASVNLFEKVNMDMSLTQGTKGNLILSLNGIEKVEAKKQ